MSGARDTIKNVECGIWNACQFQILNSKSLIPRCTLCASVSAAVLLAAVVAAQSVTDNAARVLRGAIDIHVHSDPDNVPRSIDGIDEAKLARSKGMRAIVLKNHYDPTAGLAYLARKEAPGLEE